MLTELQNPLPAPLTVRYSSFPGLTPQLQLPKDVIKEMDK